MPPSPSSSSPRTAQPSAVTLKRLQRLSHLLDNAILIPGTGYRIGIDPLLGLLPGAGDLVAGALSAYIVIESARMGLPRFTVSQMVCNLLLDVLLGSVPILGDLFDASWKANTKNLSLLEAHLKLPQSARPADRNFSIPLMVVLLVLVGASVAISLLMIRLLFRLVGG